MVRIKHTLTIASIFFLLVLLTSACKPTIPAAVQTTGRPTPTFTATKVEPTSTPVPTIGIDPAGLQGVQIHFMHPWSGTLEVEIARMIDEFNQGNPYGIFVIEDAPGSEGMVVNNLLETTSASEQPDVVALPIDQLLRLDQGGTKVADLNPYLYSSQYGFSKAEINDFMPTFWQQDEVNGYRFAIPAQRTAAVLFYNASWANSLGYTNPPSTPEEFKQQMCAANQAMKKDKDTSNDGLGGWIIATDGLSNLSWLEVFNAPLYQGGKYQFSSPEAQDALTYLHQLLTRGCGWISRTPSPYSYFSARQTLAFSGYMQDILPQTQSIKQAGNADEWVILPYPGEKKPIMIAQGPSYAVLRSTPEKQLAAWLFIRWMSSADHQARIINQSASLPLSASVLPLLKDFRTAYPQWNSIVNYLPDITVPPVDANWSNANMIIEDAAWQLYKTNLKEDQIPSLLEQMDATLEELMGRKQ